MVAHHIFNMDVPSVCIRLEVVLMDNYFYFCLLYPHVIISLKWIVELKLIDVHTHIVSPWSGDVFIPVTLCGGEVG